MTPLQHTENVLKDLATKTDGVILFYSCGKDSIALLHLCRKYFKRIECCYMAFLPGLQHNRHLIDHCKPNGIHEVTHYMISIYLANSYMRFHKDIHVKKQKQKDVEDYMRRVTGLQWIVTGQKQSDSINRRVMLRQFENDALDTKGMRCHPLSRWTNTQVKSYLRLNRLPQPVEYAPGHPSQGINLERQCLLFLREHWPADYKKIIDVFPLAETLTL